MLNYTKVEDLSEQNQLLMLIKSAEFVISNTDIKKCPEPNKAELAFIGRSNVGKSSLINMLVNHKKLAKTSSSPGKTQTINHFIINEEWYLVDLPGYGYAKVAKTKRKQWSGFIDDYIMKRENLLNLFVLVDARHKPLKNDLEFMNHLGMKGIPFSIVFTKADKISSSELKKNLAAYKKEMLKAWESMPKSFVSSASNKLGREEIINYIDTILQNDKQFV